MFFVTCSFLCSRGLFKSYGVWMRVDDPDSATEQPALADRIREVLNCLEPPERHVDSLWDLKILSVRPPDGYYTFDR